MVAKRKNCPEEFKRDAVELVQSSKDRTLTDIVRSLDSYEILLQSIGT